MSSTVKPAKNISKQVKL